ncbi:DnaA regulatory inactivator Hda [endosymbiont of Ridgeia piscesae]|jgi:DnaA family protein|uniref:Regulatory inactivation of DnaA Hda protein n=1 Tax=endosymbiont of Ridgeia piscesae TaxID=54398 RepID=A0A0T5Z2T8_9GAMM|nr:DnaA regulatory inactivator Hda [endosymbiont of Ridgeia piscesae]KRT55881.1 regulatory inactivation of DnaA Hda protein [endosymbiont of Ridgeia piscesae]KRT57226.1 regulatory inactivation of DnaA Hda protein [endosymbiont of Ridgeia piscesae]
MSALQLPLDIGFHNTVDFDGYVAGNNAEAVSSLRSANDPFIYLWGEAAVGKSHLLQAACRAQQEQGDSSAYIPLQEISSFAPEMLDGMELLELVCIDDLDRLAGDTEWEIALFNLFNRLRENSGRLLVSASVSPAYLPIELPDLASRLTWGPCYHLTPPDDASRLQLLILGAAKRGLDLKPEIAQFLLQRIPRDTRSILQRLDQLDQASLAAQRRLTIPFVREILKL